MHKSINSSVWLPVADLVEINRLCNQKGISRARYIREALEDYAKNPVAPEKIPRTRSYRKDTFGRRSIILILGLEHVHIIEDLTKRYGATKAEIVRQAVKNKALAEGEAWNPISERTQIKPDPKWEDMWIWAADIYKSLNIPRNKVYQTADQHDIEYRFGEKRKRYPKKLYRLADIVRILYLSKEDVQKIIKRIEDKEKD